MSYRNLSIWLSSWEIRLQRYSTWCSYFFGISFGRRVSVILACLRIACTAGLSKGKPKGQHWLHIFHRHKILARICNEQDWISLFSIIEFIRYYSYWFGLRIHTFAVSSVSCLRNVDKKGSRRISQICWHTFGNSLLFPWTSFRGML